jgi:hypothetical protein
MIVYRNDRQPLDTREAIERLRAPSIDPTSLLIGVGELESGIVDALCPEADSESDATRALRRATLAAARVFCGKPWRALVLAELESLAALDLPRRVAVGVSEGYAWYGLYPEAYLEAAHRFFGAARPQRAFVLGIRNIGASLSAVVAAALEDLGCAVESCTVRPHGHPFDRRLVLAPELASRIRRLDTHHFLVVDEGPGLSGSSMASVAGALSELGIPDGRIAFLPSWAPSGDAFVSESARERWRRHAKYCFGETMPLPGALDLSAGRWRGLLYADESRWPAVQPQHERRKYLDGDVLLKFAGLGRYGPPRLDRARRLADAGFCPRALGLDNGFLRTAFVDGRPLFAPGDVTPDLLDTMARYLAYLRAEFESPRAVPFDELVEMIRVNTGYEAPGEFRAVVCDAPTIAIDGRMLPHEWILTADGYLKTDAVDHHDDHFFPGCQDIAWDIAGASIEFGFDVAPLAEKYAALSGDRGVSRRLPFYLRAYAAWRLGYVTLAASATAGTADAARFQQLAARYATVLSRGAA